MVKNIGIIGDENLDFILYLTSVLKNLNKNVAVIDENKNKNYYKYLEYNDNLEKKVTYNDVDFYIDNASIIGDYDFYIENFNISDFNYEDKKLKHIYKKFLKYEVLILICKQDKLLLDTYNSIFNDIYENVNNIIVIENNIVDCKIQPTKVIKELKLDIMNKVRDIHAIPFVEKNIISTINLQYENKVSIKKLSKEYIESIKSVITYVYSDDEINDKEIKKAINKSKKGI